MTAAAPQDMQYATSLTDTDVLAWIAENPRFLLSHAETLSALADAHEVETITNLHAFRARKMQKQQASLTRQHAHLLATAHYNSLSAGMLFTAIIHVLECADLAQLRTYIQTKLRKELQLDAARLFLLGETDSITHISTNSLATQLTDDEDIALRTLTDMEEKSMYGVKGKTLKSDALLKLTTTKGATLGLLALASNDEQRFHAAQGADLINLFRRIVSYKIHSWNPKKA